MIAKREYMLYWKLNPTPYKNANKEHMELFPERLGSSTPANTAMLANTAELKVLMRPILNISPHSSDSNWDKSVKNYFDSVDYLVAKGGLQLNVSFRYDFENPDKATAIKALTTKHASIKDTKSLMNFVEGMNKQGQPNVRESDKYKYGDPVEPVSYITWRYALVSSDVANVPKDMNNSNKIKFYLYSEYMRKEKIKASMAQTRTGMKVYLDILEKPEMLENVLSILDPDYNMKASEDDKIAALKIIYDSRVNDLIKTYNDKNIIIKALIERMVKANILLRYEDSSVIVNSNDTAEVIGNNIDEAVTYFNNDVKKNTVNQFKNLLKSFTTK